MKVQELIDLLSALPKHEKSKKVGIESTYEDDGNDLGYSKSIHLIDTKLDIRMGYLLFKLTPEK